MPIFSNFPMMGPGEFIQMEDNSEGSDDPSDYVVGLGGQEEQVIMNKDFLGRGYAPSYDKCCVCLLRSFALMIL